MPENYKIEDLYQGGYSSLNPDSGSEFSTGYKTSAGSIGISTDPRTANILKEVSDKIAPGEKAIELSLIQPDVFDAIPKQHLKEINRLSKLTGVDVTVHGPLIDASGVTQQGFDEQSREINERKILQVIERSHEINPDGNAPVTFHTANQLIGARYTKTKEGEEIEMMPVVNQETGQITGVKREERYHPIFTKKGEIEKKVYTPKEQLEIMNDSQWDHALQPLIPLKEQADQIIRETEGFVHEIIPRLQSGEIKTSDLKPTQQQVLSRFNNAHEQLSDIRKQLVSQFDKAYKYGTDKDKAHLEKAAKNFEDHVKNGGLREFSSGLQEFMENLRPNEDFSAPKIFKSAEKYALEESNKTFGNVAWNAYKKFGDKAPVISIENPPAGMGLSRGQDVRDMVEGSREKFVENAMKPTDQGGGGMSKSEAEKNAEKLIGVTWDVGHINQLRQFGFTGKDIIKEAEKVAPLVKHIHLSDNFGMENTELPMGMGNVDLKEIMEKLGEKGEKATKIVEAAHWWQHQQTSPMATTFEALGSPIYSMHMAPYWNQAAGLQQGYFSGYGAMLPTINYETFGAGFSNLPAELGGQRPGAGRGRMSGTPME